MSASVTLFFVVSASVVFYNTYRYLWFNIIRLFESTTTFNSKYINQHNHNQNIDNEKGDTSFIKLIHSEELNISNIQVITYLKKISRIAFSTSITTSFLVIQFILYKFIFELDQQESDQQQQQDGGEPQLQRDPQATLWYLNISITTINLTIIHPLLILILVINKFCKSKLLNNLTVKSLITSVLFITWMVFLTNFEKLTNLDIIDPVSSFIPYYLLRTSIIGITLIATLNGIGSFSTVYYRLFYKSSIEQKLGNYPSQTQELLNNLEQTLNRTNSMIFEKEEELKSFLKANKDENSIDDGSDEYDEDGIQRRPSLYTKRSFIDIDKINPFKSTRKDHELQQELNSLKVIKNDVYLKLIKMEKSIVDTQNSKNDQFIYKVIRISLTVYCSFKIIQVSIFELISLINKNFHDTGFTTKESDPLVLTIVKTVKIFINIPNEDFLINQLSFIISGVLFLCSMNGVFLTFQHLYKFLPLDLSKLSASSTSSSKQAQSVSIIKNLLISELTGIYTLATTLILKSNLTASFNSKLNTLFSTNQNLSMSQLDHWFDKIYLISIVLTAISIKVAEHLNEDIDGFEDQELAGKIV